MGSGFAAAPRPGMTGKFSAAAAVQGVAEIGFEVREGATRLAHLYERNPLRVLFPAPVAGDVPTAVLVTTSGGLVAGDRIEIAVTAGEGAAAHVTGSAAEKIYRSTGATTEIEQTLSVGMEAWLEFLPPEAILFDRARLRRNTRIELAAGARVSRRRHHRLRPHRDGRALYQRPAARGLGGAARRRARLGRRAACRTAMSRR